LKAIANDTDNLIMGNDGDNTIEGRGGADTLTGGHGRDTFVLSRLGDSLLGTLDRPRYDHITDFSIGTDIIDGPSSVSRGQVTRLTEVADLNESTLSQHLSSQLFSANSAALFSYNDSTGERWFIALNDSTAGFSSTRDAVIEITGFTGDLSNFQIL
jgi:Ca2+-binding RTX toxin-like protein